MRLKNFSLTFGARIFKALSDESRIRIMFLLFNHKELCISDIEHILDFTQTKTSRHLIYLKNAEIVSSRKVDQYIFYFIKDEALDIVSRIFDFMKKDAQLLADLDTHKTLLSNRELAVNKLEKKRWS
ncbi:MAG: metalloregulator ArsR/SmtB family transcription factor [Cyclobacteriaceae bacterium]|nr:metalloregulator ArsR/SmtB family transcription factor [Cyclobacteriaceae bacterium]MCH8515054.1 metalloregulator ArsR/SmtB family transcription factor [Cyclobacteriaceae bacterium]